MEKNYIYHLFIHDNPGMTDMASLGFVSSNISTDGNLCICDKGDSTEEVIDIEPTKPSYVVESMTNWPHLTHTEAHQLIKYEATTEGGSDG